uniref:Uncharacterized protein n=1 Tax=Hippocampus comes TaxID=109280 RepID=A0A3Q2YX81_HIPCM
SANTGMSKDDKKEINFVHRDKFLAEMFLKAERSVKPHTTFQVNPLKKTHILPDTPTTMDPSIVMAKIKEPGFADTTVVKLNMDPHGKKEDLWDPEAEEDLPMHSMRLLPSGTEWRLNEMYEVKLVFTESKAAMHAIHNTDRMNHIAMATDGTASSGLGRHGKRK